MNEINLLASAFTTNILAFSETWLEPEIANIISLNGYKCIHVARPKSVKGGGVGVEFFYWIKFKL